MPSDWLIRNAEPVNEGRRFHADLRVKDGRILKSSIVGTFVNGRRMRDDATIDDSVRGRRLASDR
ncbi:MAG: hypothetical protein KGJ32_04485 [Xanthomonadaceae bacterium]|nr:hypothetical protein [Xanthomonadaceae bacterium]